MPWWLRAIALAFFGRGLRWLRKKNTRAKGRAFPIAGAFNVASHDRLYGRYWGSVEDRPFLHFHVCYYHSIEECVRRDLHVFEPGAGGEHKVPRGFSPTLTSSAHWLTDPRMDRAVREHLAYEREAVEEAPAAERVRCAG